MTFPLLLQGKDTRHEELEDDQGPEESVECDTPCFTIRFVWLEVDCFVSMGMWMRESTY